MVATRSRTRSRGVPEKELESPLPSSQRRKSRAQSSSQNSENINMNSYRSSRKSKDKTSSKSRAQSQQPRYYTPTHSTISKSSKFATCQKKPSSKPHVSQYAPNRDMDSIPTSPSMTPQERDIPAPSRQEVHYYSRESVLAHYLSWVSSLRGNVHPHVVLFAFLLSFVVILVSIAWA